MGVERLKGGRSIRREQLAADGVEGIRRNAAGDIQHQNVNTFSGTAVNTTGFTTTTAVPRAFATSVSLTINTTNTAGGGGATINTPAGGTLTTAIGNGNATAQTTTLSPAQAPATWTLSISVTTGTVTVTSWVVSREDERS